MQPNSLVDIDECTDGTDNCTDGCVNTEGSYYCTCSEGYELMDGNNTCVGELTLSYSSCMKDYIKLKIIFFKIVLRHSYCYIK